MAERPSALFGIVQPWACMRRADGPSRQAATSRGCGCPSTRAVRKLGVAAAIRIKSVGLCQQGVVQTSMHVLMHSLWRKGPPGCLSSALCAAAVVMLGPAVWLRLDTPNSLPFGLSTFTSPKTPRRARQLPPVQKFATMCDERTSVVVSLPRTQITNKYTLYAKPPDPVRSADTSSSFTSSTTTAVPALWLEP